MIMTAENKSSRNKPVQVPLCRPQIPREMTWDGTCFCAVSNGVVILSLLLERQTGEEQNKGDYELVTTALYGAVHSSM